MRNYEKNEGRGAQRMAMRVPGLSTRGATAKAISPFRLFFLLLLVLFIVEAIIMFILPLLFPGPDTLLANVADALLLVTLSAPFLWILIVQPLRTAVAREATWAGALFEHVVDGVVVLDGNGTMVLLNPAAEQIFGYSLHEAIGQPLNALLNEQAGWDRERFPLHGDHLHHDILGRRKDGTLFPMDFSVSNVSLAGETAFIGIVRDITKRKQIEMAMLEKQSQLAELNLSLEQRVAATVSELREKDRILIQQSRLAAMGEMINNIAHQWRQPLNVLALLAQKMRLCYDMGSFTPEFLHESVNKSMDLINHLSRTIDDFRNFFEPDKEKTEFMIHEVVARTISLVEDNFSHLQIHIDFHGSATPAVIGFPNEYSQVLLNILMNARDALVEHQPDKAIVAITIATEGDWSVVTISDNGGGMDDGVMGKIFDPYFTTKGPDRGTGLGLYMSKTIIEKNMNGRLTARNTADGAEFRIEIRQHASC